MLYCEVRVGRIIANRSLDNLEREKESGASFDSLRPELALLV